MAHLEDLAEQEVYDEEEFTPNQTYDGYPEEPGTPSAVHQCNVCNKIFVNFKGLQQHAVIHTDSKPYVCEICGRGFRFKSNMFEHRTVHTGYTPHLCPFCGKNFRLKGNMKKHMRVHVSTKEELEIAYRPYSSNRRPNTVVPENAIIIRGCSLPYYTPVKSRNSKKLQLGNNSSKWVNMICRNELLPYSNVEEKLMRISMVVYRNHSLSTLFEVARAIEFEIFHCPFCKCACAGKVSCENHIIEAHGKKLDDLQKDFYCDKCARSFPDDDILRQHQSYHSRVELMTRNREIECLNDCPGVPINLICYDLLNGTNQVQTSSRDSLNTEDVALDDVVAGPELKMQKTVLFQQDSIPNQEMMESPSEGILTTIFAMTETKPVGCVMGDQLSNPNEISLSYTGDEEVVDELNNNNAFQGNNDEVLSSVIGITGNDEIGDGVI